MTSVKPFESHVPVDKTLKEEELPNFCLALSLLGLIYSGFDLKNTFKISVMLFSHFCKCG